MVGQWKGLAIATALTAAMTFIASGGALHVHDRVAHRPALEFGAGEDATCGHSTCCHHHGPTRDDDSHTHDAPAGSHDCRVCDWLVGWTATADVWPQSISIWATQVDPAGHVYRCPPIAMCKRNSAPRAPPGDFISV